MATMTALEQAAVEMLRKIVAEVAGPGTPYSADSYLPAHLIFDARSVIEDFDRQMTLAMEDDL
ncbi:MAG TPA: hypothetical protein P5195_04355 [Anaerolineae bacterium]|nr:hypothetical protein [Anaerolineae bacterium]